MVLFFQVTYPFMKNTKIFQHGHISPGDLLICEKYFFFNIGLIYLGDLLDKYLKKIHFKVIYHHYTFKV